MKCEQCGIEFDSKFCPNCEIKEKIIVESIVTDTKQNKEKEMLKDKKPFYKKWWFIAIVIVAALVIFNNINFEKVDWSTLQLALYIPEPEKGRVSVGLDSDDYLSVDFENTKLKYFNEYVDACVEMGYTVEAKRDSDSYKAFNSDGYEIDISYYDSLEEVSVTLKAPTEMSEIQWPTKGIGTMIPTATSTLGKVIYDTSDSFEIIVGNTAIEEFNTYVKACQNKGFTIDYNKQDDYYYAKNAKGYRLNLRYIGANRMEISIQNPEKTTDVDSSKTTTSVESEKTTTTTTTKKETTTSGMSKEFKQAMDSYEAAMNEYIAFMKKYKKSNGTDMSLLSDYSKYMTKYAEACEAFAKWEDEDLNATESAYYLKVQTRINKKLLEVAY